MAKKYLDELRALMKGAMPSATAPDAPHGAELAFKHFFGGAALYADGRICITLTTAGLALKLPEDGREQLLGEGAVPLRYFPNGPIKKEYVVVPADLCEDAGRLGVWARESVRYVLSLPKPGGK